ncbi:MAG: hypothetical protein ACRYG8_46445 [Janthinobacterium lividum]
MIAAALVNAVIRIMIFQAPPHLSLGAAGALLPVDTLVLGIWLWNRNQGVRWW